MRFLDVLSALVLVIAFTLISIACSNGKSPVEPSSGDIAGISSDLPISFGSIADSRNVLAAYDAVIDPSDSTFAITSVE